MSQENVDLAKAGVAALNEAYASGDMEPWVRHVKLAFDPDVVLEASPDVFTEGEWRGHQGVIDFVANQMDVLEGMWMEADEIIDVDDDCLVAAIKFGGKARHTGIPFELSPVHVFDLRDGKAVRWRVFGSRSQGLKAAGLGE